MELVELTLTGWSSIFVTLSIAVFTGIMFILGRERVHYLFGLAALSVTIWIGGFYGAVISTTPEVALFWWKISYVGVIFLPVTFLHFIYEFIDVAKVRKPGIVLLYGTALIFVILNLSTNLIVDNVKFLFGELYYGQPGLLHPYFFVLYTLLIGYAFYLVFKEYGKRKNDELFRQRVVYLLIGNLMAFTGGSLNFLPIYEIQVPPTTNVSVAFGVGILTYAILRYRLLDARVVIAQFLTLILVGFTLFRLIISTPGQEMILNGVLLIFTLGIGVYLILSVKKEVIQREQLAVANIKLERLNEEKTAFLSFASHELRYAPTAIRNASSMLLEGSYGELTQKVRETIQNIFNLAQGDLKLVDDYLNVARIEQGKIKYDFKPVNLTKMVSTVIDNFEGIAKETNTRIEKAFNAEKEITIKLDESKIGEVLNNLVDNAVEKYAKGTTVSVSLEPAVDGSKVLIKLSDTGIGMSKETIAKLFQRFSRARNVERDSKGIKGSGLGLYLARQYVLAHGGRIWAESAGEGKGSVFFLELPAIPPENTLVAFNEGENKPEEISA